MRTPDSAKPTTPGQLKDSGRRPVSVKQEIHDNLLAMLASGERLFPGVVGYQDTFNPGVCLALLAKHDMLFLGEKGQAKSRLMRGLVRFLDSEIPCVRSHSKPST